MADLPGGRRRGGGQKSQTSEWIEVRRVATVAASLAEAYAFWDDD